MNIDDMPRREHGLRRLYAFQFSDGRMKIGITRDVKGRASSICVEHRRYGLDATISFAWWSTPHINAHSNEERLHEMLGVHRLTGEYFDVTPDALMEAVGQLEMRSERTSAEVARAQAIQAAFDAAVGSPAAIRDQALINDLVSEAEAIFGEEASRQLRDKLQAA